MVNFRTTIFIFAWFICFGTSGQSIQLGRPANQNPNPVWNQFQPKLARLIDSFERVCKSQDVDFDRHGIETQLQSCFNSPMKELMEIVDARDSSATIQLVTIVEKLKPGSGGATTSSASTSFVPSSLSLSHKEIELLRIHFVEPICFFTSTILDCFSPHYTHIIDQCTSDPEGKAMQYSDQIFIAACRNNGSRLIDFLETGGIQCIDQYFNSAMECLNKQSLSFSESMDLLKHKRRPDSLSELCSDLTEIHSCLITSLGACQRTEPARIMRSVLSEVQDWTVDACLKSGAAEKGKAHAYSSACMVKDYFIPQILILLIMFCIIWKVK